MNLTSNNRSRNWVQANLGVRTRKQWACLYHVRVCLLDTQMEISHQQLFMSQVPWSTSMLKSQIVSLIWVKLNINSWDNWAIVGIKWRKNNKDKVSTIPKLLRVWVRCNKKQVKSISELSLKIVRGIMRRKACLHELKKIVWG